MIYLDRMAVQIEMALLPASQAFCTLQHFTRPGTPVIDLNHRRSGKRRLSKSRRRRPAKVAVDSSRHCDSPAFEVLKFYTVKSFRQISARHEAAYRQPPHYASGPSEEHVVVPVALYRNHSTNEQGHGPMETAEDPPEIEAAAGTILSIYSPQIVRATDSVTTTFPSMRRDGESVIVTEPYCMLLYFREQMMNQSACIVGAADETRGSEEIDTASDS